MAQSSKSQLSSRFARRTLAESSLILAVCMVAAVVVMQVMHVTPNDVDESGPASPVVEPPAIADSAFMIRDGKFDCSTIFDQASLTQLVESGIAYIPGFNRLTDKSVSTGADGRIICERAVSVEDGVQFTYFIMSKATPWGGKPEDAEPDAFGWVHEIPIKNDNGEIQGYGSFYSDEERGFLLVAAMRDIHVAAGTTPEADAVAANKAKDVAEKIAPILDRSVKAEAANKTADAKKTANTSQKPSLTFYRDGHYSCRAFMDTATMKAAKEIGLEIPRLPGAKAGMSSPQDAENVESFMPGTELCGFSHNFDEVDIITVADPEHPVCTANSGVALKKLPEWSYFVDPRPAQYASDGKHQGEISLNLLHKDEAKGCVVVRSYSDQGNLPDLQKVLAKISPVAGLLSALEKSLDQPATNVKEQK
ncbi:hypothetical protein [Corynebacterium amycolatum]|uniref:hypothetical protein n=1 Tax=Corynebacterium amycolatum TaxID=43765 RepID=UPI0012FDA31A|nr:hypothetical protein [Corynebacterium amycolatum]